MTTLYMADYRQHPRRYSENFCRKLPVKPHDPADRVLLGTINARSVSTILTRWEVRALDPAGPFHHYFAKNELLHLQLWNSYFGISVLTPSKLTADKYEVYPLSGWKLGASSYEYICSQIEKNFATRLPNETEVRKLTRDFIEAVSENSNHSTNLALEQQNG